MDVAIWFPGSTWWAGIDVTVRYPGASRYTTAGEVPGAAARRAEQEKHKRYGDCVLPLAYELGGRLGEEGHEALAQLAATAIHSNPTTSTTVRNLVLRWRRRLEAALVFAVADSYMLALGCCIAGRSANFAWISKGMVDARKDSDLGVAQVHQQAVAAQPQVIAPEMPATNAQLLHILPHAEEPCALHPCSP